MFLLTWSYYIAYNLCISVFLSGLFIIYLCQGAIHKKENCDKIE